MTATAFSGPIITCREDPYSNMANPPVGQPANQNPDGGPSMFHMAVALLDPRWQYTYDTGQGQNPLGFDSSGNAIQTAPTLGWLSATFQVADYAPGTAATFSLAPIASAATASTSITLTTSTQNGVTPATTMTNAVSGAVVSGLWRIDSNPAPYTFGTGSFGVWDPANPAIGRCVTITSPTGVNLSANTFTVSGYDAYGYPITQTLAGPNAATVITGKAFKWISGVSIAATASATSTFSIGVSDTYGFPLFAPAFGYIRAFWNNSNVETSAATTFTAGTTATTAGATDVRGTVGLAGLTVSNGVRKLQMWMSVAPSNLTAGALFGVVPA